MALALLIGGIVMWAVDAWSAVGSRSTTDIEQMSLGQAIWIGLCQIPRRCFRGPRGPCRPLRPGRSQA